jgi:hypothetical protein
MAPPWTFEQRLAAYRAEGITDIVVMSGAKTHNRDDETGRAFGLVYGVTIHHTAGVSPNMASVIYNGVSGLPGPLAQDFLAKDGTLYVVGHGRCNHAGSVTPAVKAAIIAEKAPGNERTIGSETEDGNDFLYGLEIENKGDGDDPYPAKQYDVAVRWAAAHLRHHGWTENSAWGHKEITGRKIDPSFSMNTFRANVKARLDNEEDDVALTTEDISKVAEAVVTALTGTAEGRQKLVSAIFRTDGVVDSPGGPEDPGGNFHWWAQSYLREGYLVGEQVKGKLGEIELKVNALQTGGVDLDALAVKVADKLAERLAE